MRPGEGNALAGWTAALLAASVVALAACTAAPEGDDTNGKEEPPLLLEDEGEEPLLLLDGEGDEDDSLADNSRCHVCHANFMQEKLAVVHARAGMGCAECHGNCDEHIADESWASGGNGTPPGIMYPPDKINPFCMGCHSREKIEGPQHKALLAGTSKKKHCTDCHGKHRLAQRKCKWK